MVISIQTLTSKYKVDKNKKLVLFNLGFPYCLPDIIRGPCTPISYVQWSSSAAASTSSGGQQLLSRQNDNHESLDYQTGVYSETGYSGYVNEPGYSEKDEYYYHNKRKSSDYVSEKEKKPEIFGDISYRNLGLWTPVDCTTSFISRMR